LDGQYVENPVLKSELDVIGALDSTNRMFPTLPDTAPIRIPQFDGGPLITTNNEIILPDTSVVVDSEQYRITLQQKAMDYLRTGFGGTSPSIPGSLVVTTAIDQNTGSISVDYDPMDTASFSVGDTFVVSQSGQQIGILVTGVTSTGSGTCDNPIYTDQATCELNGGVWTPTSAGYDLDIQVLTSGSVGASGSIDENWAGFSNTDRINKVDATNGYTYMLNQMIIDLDTAITNRLSKLDNQSTALQANLDTSLDPQALIDVQNSVTILQDWQIDQGVDDTELTALDSEVSTRTTNISARIIAIEAAKAVYYNARYTSANNIANTSYGTARVKFFRIDSQGVTADFLAADQARQQSIVDLLTLAGEPTPIC
jgi:hypothetical protein